MYMPTYNFNNYQYDQIKQGNDGFEDAYNMWYKKNNDDDLKENKKPKNERKEESNHAASRTNNYGYIIWELIVNVSFWI